ncbi:MAG: tetratricopeptide repeat protein [bacterium]
MKRKIIVGWVIVLVLVWMGLRAQLPQEKNDFEYGERLYREGLFDLAKTQFQGFLENYPGSPKTADAQLFVGQCAFTLHRFDEAQRAYLRLILRYPNSALVDRAQFGIAECSEKTGALGEAADSYFRIYNFYPKSEWVDESLYRSARLWMTLGDLVRSESTVNVLLERVRSVKSRLKAELLLVEVLRQKGEYQRAIERLRPYLTESSEPFLRGEAAFRMGEIYEEMGRWEEAKETYQNVLRLPATDSLGQRAWFRLGFQYMKEGEDTRSIEAFRQSAEKDADSCLVGSAYFTIGEIQSRKGDYQAALDAFGRAEDFRTNADISSKIRYEKARCLQSSGRHSQALRAYESIIADSSVSISIYKKSMLSLAYLYIQTNAFEKAIQRYDGFLDSFDKDPLADGICLRVGKIYLQNLNLLEEGLNALRRIWQRNPSGRFVPEARFLYADGLERAGRATEALRVYRMVSQQYRGTVWAEKAEERAREIEWFRPMDAEQGIAHLFSIATKLLSGERNPHILFECGEIAFKSMKRYEEAIGYFRRFLSEVPDSEDRDDAIFQIGKSFEALSVKENRAAFQDSARRYYSLVLSDYPRSTKRDEAGLRLACLESKASPDFGYEAFVELIKNSPNSSRMDEILYRAGDAAVRIDSLVAGLNNFQRLADGFPESSFFEESLFRIGKIRFQTGKFSEADSVFQMYSRQFPEGAFRPESQYLSARYAIHRKDHQTAIPLLEELNRRYYHSAWSDSGRTFLAELYLRTGAFSDAVRWYETALDEDSLNAWAASVGLRQEGVSKKQWLLSGLARAYEGLKRYKEAKKTYIEYGREYRMPEDRVFVFSALARIAEDEWIPERAEDYLNRIVEEMPSDSTAGALGLLRFRLGQYEEAITTFDQAFRLTQDVRRQALFTSKVAISLLRQGKIPQADVRMNVFSQSFKSDPKFNDYMAEFVLEKGKAYFSRKEFDPALQSFEEVVRRYRDSVYRPDAELEMGRVYLVTNKVEDALKILTEMPARYPDHPVLARVYLNLGDHYFQSHQYDNAVETLKRAIAWEGAPDIVPIAMRYLIRVYDSIGMWDAALAFTRRYIQRYPRAEDILQKRVQIGIYYYQLHEYSRAVEVLRDVKRDADSETEAEIQYYIGDSFYSMGQFEQAIFEFLKVEYVLKPTKLPWASTALYKAGQAYLKMNRTGQARQIFEKVVQKEGATSDMGRVARERIEEIDRGEFNQK